MAAGLDSVAESVLAQSLQDARALSVRAQESAATIHNLAMANAVALQHQASLRALQLGFDTAEVAASYRGNHLRSGAEFGVREATAEGEVLKDASQASLPISQAQASSNVLDLEAKLAQLTTLVMQLVKAGQTTPPQTGGYAPESPSPLGK